MRRAVNLVAREAIGCTLFGAILLASPVAESHPQTTPSYTNHYASVRILGDEVRIAYTVLVGDRPAYDLLRFHDRDRNGTLSRDEEKALVDKIESEVEGALIVSIDGSAYLVRFDERSLGVANPQQIRVLPTPLALDFEVMVPLQDVREHTVLIDDKYEPSNGGENEISFEESPNVRILAAFHGRKGEKIETLRFAWNAPRRSSLEDRTVGVRFTASRENSWRRALGAAAIIAGLLTAVALAVRSRQRRTKG